MTGQQSEWIHKSYADDIADEAPPWDPEERSLEVEVATGMVTITESEYQELLRYRADAKHQYHPSKDLYPKELVGSFLKYISDVQRRVNRDVPECLRNTPHNVRTFSFALNHEVMEFADELGWKPWKKPPEVINWKVADEFGDVIAFMGMLVCYAVDAGVSYEALAEGYIEKSLVNIDRMEGRVEGYGVENVRADATR